ncbi:uncharacterized protein LTHEOB_5137 [Lasiodiplodia theobromae]|uniref:uncharacterized protein n=1 Tax=Lasiodiplodia theobromae TaxID=45133 RepID=UPI0015C372B0|nr:uncharacterized protein LTHEOB_5137 [Lasiodiplodia theobromae]KAF4545304.1 hypothetical protein LTHEOB_5137 [Lasiodiplodia theobromae]
MNGTQDSRISLSMDDDVWKDLESLGDEYNFTYPSTQDQLMIGNNSAFAYPDPTLYAISGSDSLVNSSGFDAIPHADDSNIDFLTSSALNYVQPEMPVELADPTQSSSVALKTPAVPATTASRLSSLSNRRSSTSSLSDIVELASRKFTQEKPKYDPKHPWHRINTTTMGMTSRSGKINQYASEQMYKQNIKNPFGTWRSPNYKFEYFEHGELKKLEYSANEINDFLHHHPKSADNILRVWIQKTPADSCRRYPTPTLSKCRFKECPLRREGLNGTIQAGHMRVAFDERSSKYNNRADPFYMAAFFHLYCFEMFLDLPEICTLKNIEVREDTRKLPNEPNMSWNGSLDKEGVVAQRFIEACRKGRSTIKGFDGYPRPHNMQPGDAKSHELMLNYRMQKTKEGNRARSAKQSLAKRVQRETQINVNFGDLEMLVRAKVSMRKPRPAPKKRNKRRQVSISSSGDNDADYVSEPDSPDGMRKKRRTDDGPSGGVAEAVVPPGYAPANQLAPQQQQSSYNGADVSTFGYGRPEYAWPQSTLNQNYPANFNPTPVFVAAPSADAAGGDPANTFTTTTDDAATFFYDPEISASNSNAVDPALEDMFNGFPVVVAADSTDQTTDALPDYPPISDLADATTTFEQPPIFFEQQQQPVEEEEEEEEEEGIDGLSHQSVTIPTSFPLNPDFSLSKPTKRSASVAFVEDDASSPSKRPRRSQSSHISPKTIPSKKRGGSSAVSVNAITRITRSKSSASMSPAPVQTPKTPPSVRRKSSRLNSLKGVDNGGVVKRRRTRSSSKLSGGGRSTRSDSRLSSVGSLGSIGDLFGFDE